MPAHDNLHRRHARAALPFALPDAIADALADADPDPEPVARPQQTLVSVVYVTAKPTFDGPIGGYSTVGVEASTRVVDASVTPEVVAKPTATPIVVASDDDKTSIAAATDVSPTVRSKAVSTTLRTSTALPTAITSPSTTVGSSLGLLAATGGFSSSLTSEPSLSAASSSATSTAEPATSEGMSAGGKAGLALGILLLVGAVLAIVLFCFKKRKDATKERLNDEKNDVAFASARRAESTCTTATTATAPRLSLRPVTQFLPNLGEKRQSRGNALLTAAAPIAAPQHVSPPSSSQEHNRDNPFGNHAEAIDATKANGPTPVEVSSPTGEVVAAGAIAGAAATGAVVGLARGASKRGNGPKPMDFTTKGGVFMGPPSPAGTEFSQTESTTAAQTGTGAAIAAAGGPANSAVHRVQLDFKPSMEDELELRAGQLVRVLHEYDDGWALCIRLDRSQQGVCPRTCLSTRPVKPRPQQPRSPPPGMRGPQGQPRPMSPAGMQGPPRGPPGQARAMSPGINQSQRPMSPAGPQHNPQRPNTPNGQGRPRSPSTAQMQARRVTPPGPSPMNPVVQAEGAEISQPGPAPQNLPPSVTGSIGRKPVPGQAL